MTKKFKVETFTKKDSGALKDEAGKPMVDLVTPEMITAIAEVLTYGSKKYEPRNWEKGIPYMANYAAAMRHLLQWHAGVDIDEESGLRHIDQAVTNLAMIATQTRRERSDLDDRPK